MRACARVAVIVLPVVLAGCGGGSPLKHEIAVTTTTVSPTTVSSATTGPDTTDGSVITGDTVAGVDFAFLDLPPGDPYSGDYVEIVDDTGTIRVEVPEEWTDVETTPTGDFDSEEEWPYIAAAPDLTIFRVEQTGPGVAMWNNVSATAEQEELDDFSAGLNLSRDCEDMATYDYDDGSYTGIAELWTGCKDDEPDRLVVSTLVDGSHLLVWMQLSTEADLEAAAKVIETFSFTGE